MEGEAVLHTAVRSCILCTPLMHKQDEGGSELMETLVSMELRYSGVSFKAIWRRRIHSSEAYCTIVY